MKRRGPISLLKLLTDADLKSADIIGNPDVMLTGIGTHAQSISRNHVFVALSGTRTDSHMLVGEAVSHGAAALIVEKDVPTFPGVTTVRVANTRQALGSLAHAFYGRPARAMTVTGVTGTNGKTTTTHLIRDILATAGMRVGLIGTLGSFWQGRECPSLNTTPGPLELAGVMAEMEADRVQAVVMEVSSIAVHQGRIAGLPMHAGAFVCIGQDHLDYHGDYASYVSCKRRLFFDYFGRTPGSVASFNADDPVGEELLDSYDGDKVGFSAQAQNTNAEVRATDVVGGAEGTELTLHVGKASIRLRAPLVGSFNLTNMLAAASVAHSLGVDAATIARGLKNLGPVPGRFERIDVGQPFTVIVDYAHTADALERVLRAARRLTRDRVITVFGCGGDRDRSKRPAMGRAVGQLSDFAVLTSDNPRTEDPELIARQALEGLLSSGLKPSRYVTQLDRRRAIEFALNMASPGDVVLIAGKGHESYQEIHGIRHPFDDRSVAREVLETIVPNFQTTRVRVESFGPNAHAEA